MEHHFDLEVFFENEFITLPAILRGYLYHYQIIVDIQEHTVYFELDEQRTFRAVIENPHSRKRVPQKLLAATAKELQKIFYADLQS